jgi:phosphate acetyltransferase
MDVASTNESERQPHAKYDRLIAAAKQVPPAVTIVAHPCDASRVPLRITGRIV